MGSPFGWLFASTTSTTSNESEIPEIYPLALKSGVFVKSDIHHTFLKILTDTMERTHGLTEKQEPLLWDSCVQSQANQGLITLLATAMAEKQELFLVYSPSVGVIRKATFEEQAEIRKDYLAMSESKKGVYVSFKNYQRTDMLEIYSSFEYCVLASLNKTLNLAKATQLKISDLRSSVSLVDSSIAKAQAQSIALALKAGNDVLLDVKDMIETAKPDTSPTEKAITFLDAKRAFILGLPLSYISGMQTPGIGSTGEADMRAVERGLKQYFTSILRPVLKAVFGKETEFRSQDFREMNTALEALKTFDLVSDEHLSQESKRAIMARLFDLDPKQEQKKIDKEEKERDANGEEEKPRAGTPPPFNGKANGADDASTNGPAN